MKFGIIKALPWLTKVTSITFGCISLKNRKADGHASAFLLFLFILNTVIQKLPLQGVGGLFHVQPFFFGQQFFFSFAYVLVIYTTINRANGSTLRLIMKTHTFGTLIRNDIINII